ncbi:MAG: adhesin [Salinivirgaceae bacterium]|nr:MAG: adhesin [Salinivirgaceae bacterium]
MPLQNRESLKDYFRKGQLPSEGHFHDLIDSTINKVDDGMSKTMEDGLMLAPIGESRKLISFFKSIEDKSPVWRMEVDENDADLHFSNKVGDEVLSVIDTGKVGINNAQPEANLDVNGYVAMSGREGNAYRGKVPADGKWHKIATELNGCQMFEVVAGVGKKKTGKYGLLHAIAMSAFGKSKNKITKTQARYGIRGNRMKLRWTGSTYKFNLEIKTRSNYGDDVAINYHIQKLWHDQFMDNCVLEVKEDK